MSMKGQNPPDRIPGHNPLGQNPQTEYQIFARTKFPGSQDYLCVVHDLYNISRLSDKASTMSTINLSKFPN